MFTPPRTGWYNICAYMRFKNSGNANDIVLYKVKYIQKFTARATENSLRIIKRSVREIFPEKDSFNIISAFFVSMKWGQDLDIDPCLCSYTEPSGGSFRRT
jgi:hypothetical protein